MGDLVRLTQVLGNLLNKASKYTGEGGAIALDAPASEARAARLDTAAVKLH